MVGWSLLVLHLGYMLAPGWSPQQRFNSTSVKEDGPKVLSCVVDRIRVGEAQMLRAGLYFRLRNRQFLLLNSRLIYISTVFLTI